MADRTHSYADNVPGAFYVDDSCIDCDMCLATASENFERNQGRRYSYIANQPENDEQRALCLQAMEECPVAAIGYDKDLEQRRCRQRPRSVSRQTNHDCCDEEQD